MSECCNIVYNSEILLNEAHQNNYIFVLEKIPVSFLFSKYNTLTPTSTQRCINVFGPGPTDTTFKATPDVTQEQNNDTRNLGLFTKAFTLPGVKGEIFAIPNPNTPKKVISGKLDFNLLETTFLMDEYHILYKMFYFWMQASFNTVEFRRYNEVAYEETFYVDGHLIILDNNRNKAMEWTFKNLHPYSLPDLKFAYEKTDKMDLTITWIYDEFLPSDDYKILFKQL